jgi:hypothetical protein
MKTINTVHAYNCIKSFYTLKALYYGRLYYGNGKAVCLSVQKELALPVRLMTGKASSGQV